MLITQQKAVGEVQFVIHRFLIKKMYLTSMARLDSLEFKKFAKTETFE
jgi:hypothetical protein